MFVNTVGTFGVSSASYYWSRVSAAVGRLTQYLISRYATTWIMLLADDYQKSVVPTFVLLSWCSSSSVKSSVALFPGIRPTEVQSRTGLVLSCCSENTPWVLQSEERLGWLSGHVKRRQRKLSTSGRLWKHWEG